LSDDGLEQYLQRPLSAVDPGVAAAVACGPIERSLALARGEVDSLLDPSPLPAETGWCTLADGVGYVAVRTAMPAVTAEMVDWWFDWHPRESTRYRVWHPAAHLRNSLIEPARQAAKAHWGAVHHPVEDIGTGQESLRIEFMAPSRLGMSTDALDLAEVATVVCGLAGDQRRRVSHTIMFHVFLNHGAGVVLRSRFWIGAAVRPYGRAGALGAALLNNRVARRAIIPGGVPAALARHCAEEYANLASLLPELYASFGPGAV
jgi:hypothetical protein